MVRTTEGGILPKGGPFYRRWDFTEGGVGKMGEMGVEMELLKSVSGGEW